MPELPEVETVVRCLEASGLPGQCIRGIHIYDARALHALSPAAFARRLRGRCIVRVGRRGKYIVMELDRGLWLLIHLRMSGRLTLHPSGAPREIHDRVGLVLEHGCVLRFHDPRRFGRWVLTSHPESILDRLGPEPLDRRLTAPVFARRLRVRRRQLKPLLLDQSFLAGLGNIYVDESLWRAGLHPCRLAATLDVRESEQLLRAIRQVLRLGIRRLGTTLAGGRPHFRLPDGRPGRNRQALRVYGRAGKSCVRCGATLQRLLVGQRGTCLCLQCQAPPPSGSCRNGTRMVRDGTRS